MESTTVQTGHAGAEWCIGELLGSGDGVRLCSAEDRRGLYCNNFIANIQLINKNAFLVRQNG